MAFSKQFSKRQTSLLGKEGKRMTTGLIKRFGGGIALLFYSEWARSELHFNLQTPQTSIARQIYDLHNWILLVCLVIFVVVFGVMFYSIIKHRKSLGHQAQPFHENTTVEMIWTIIPFFILAGMAYPATK